MSDTRTEPQSHQDIIGLWKKAAHFGRAIGVKPNNARMMVRLGIPQKHFEAVVDAAAKAGFEGVTYALLCRLPRIAPDQHPDPACAGSGERDPAPQVAQETL
jgi:hypothetical protein